MLTEGSTETPNGLAWKSRRGPRAGHVRQGVPQKLGSGCRFHRVIGLQGEPESEITHSACCAGEAEGKKTSASGGTQRRGQTEAGADERQSSERLIVPWKPGNSTHEDPAEGSGRWF
jgi:hypothetical protein